MKLNKKGYMLVEIIVSFVLAFSIAMFLLNLALKFKDTNEDIYYSTLCLKDKTLIVRNIMDDLSNGYITKITNFNCDESSNICEIIFEFDTDPNDGEVNGVVRKLIINKGEKIVKYGKFDNTTNKFITNDDSYYYKKLEDTLFIEKINAKKIEDDFFDVNIKVGSIYTDDNYNISIFGKSYDLERLTSEREILEINVVSKPTKIGYKRSESETDINYTGLNINVIYDGGGITIGGAGSEVEKTIIETSNDFSKVIRFKIGIKYGEKNTTLDLYKLGWYGDYYHTGDGSLINGEKKVPVSNEKNALERIFYFENSKNNRFGWYDKGDYWEYYMQFAPNTYEDGYLEYNSYDNLKNKGYTTGARLEDTWAYIYTSETPYWYYFDSDGVMLTGWYQDPDDKWYYLKPAGYTGWNGPEGSAIVSAWADINNYWYHFSSDGKMETGWYQDTDDKWYYLKPASYTGWSGPEGAALVSTTVTIDGSSYTFNSSGACISRNGC